jgi:hypothetical protein
VQDVTDRELIALGEEPSKHFPDSEQGDEAPKPTVSDSLVSL